MNKILLHNNDGAMSNYAHYCNCKKLMSNNCYYSEEVMEVQ